MELLKKFQELNIHSDESREKPVNQEKPYTMTARVKLDSKKTLLGSAFNMYLSPDETQILACVGSKYVHVFSLPKDANVITPVWGTEMQSTKEDLYTVTWCFDTYEAEQNRNPYKIVTGGAGGQIYVIDGVDKSLVNCGQFVGGAINDLRTCPTNPNLVACGSKDSTIRIFHIRNQEFLVTMGGMHGHADQVLSVDWSANGDYILSCGFDHQIMKWDLTATHVKKHLEACCKALKSGEMNILTQTTPLPDYDEEPDPIPPPQEGLQGYEQSLEVVKAIKEHISKMRKPEGCFMPIYAPMAVCSDLHVDYVDCVRTSGESDYIFSKGCGKESAIYLWRFGAPENITENFSTDQLIAKTATKLMMVEVPHGDTWFVKFEIDPTNKWLACGGAYGTICIFSLEDFERGPVLKMENYGNSPIRQMTFSSDGRFLVAIDETGHIMRLDRVPADVDLQDFSKAFPLTR